jgi:hypothetical protein
MKGGCWVTVEVKLNMVCRCWVVVKVDMDIGINMTLDMGGTKFMNESTN